MKNENMRRSIHNVCRSVVFSSEEEARRFQNMYSDLYYHNQDKQAWNHDGCVLIRLKEGGYKVLGTIEKRTFDQIVKDLGLCKEVSTTWGFKVKEA